MPDESSGADAGGRQYYFLHIPKTAGTSLRSLIESQFPADRICPSNHTLQAFGGNYPPIREILEIPQPEFDAFGLVRGHYFHNMVAKFSRMPHRLTMLRKPYDRSVSFLRHTLRGAPNYEDMDIDDLLSNEHFVKKYLRDFQVKMLALEFDNSNPANVPVDVNVPVVSGPKLLESAKALLDGFEYVGIAEEFEKSVELLAWRFDWDVAGARPRLNRSPKKVSLRDTPSEESQRIIREATQLDEQLYEHAVAVFTRQYEDACSKA